MNQNNTAAARRLSLHRQAQAILLENTRGMVNLNRLISLGDTKRAQGIQNFMDANLRRVAELEQEADLIPHP
jgi:hypothetical protein